MNKQKIHAISVTPAEAGAQTGRVDLPITHNNAKSVHGLGPRLRGDDGAERHARV